jgi:hypothetical protein
MKNILNSFLLVGMLILSPPVRAGGETEIMQKSVVAPVKNIQRDLNIPGPMVDQRISLNACIFKNAKVPDNLMKLWGETAENDIAKSPLSSDKKAILMLFLGDGYCCKPYVTVVDFGLAKTATEACIGMNAYSLGSTISKEGEKIRLCNRENYEEYIKSHPDDCGNSIAAQFLPLPDYQKYVDCQVKRYEELTALACGVN